MSSSIPVNHKNIIVSEVQELISFMTYPNECQNVTTNRGRTYKMSSVLRDGVNNSWRHSKDDLSLIVICSICLRSQNWPVWMEFRRKENVVRFTGGDLSLFWDHPPRVRDLIFPRAAPVFL